MDGKMDGNRNTILITETTWLKQSTGQASDLPSKAKSLVQKGSSFPVVNHEELEDLGEDGDQHIKFTLENPVDGKYTWFVFQRHASILEGNKVIFPCPEEDPILVQVAGVVKEVKPTGIKINLPSGKVVYDNQPIITNGNFTWREATHGTNRIPLFTEHEENIINLAIHLQKLSDSIGKPCRITSWYRPQPFNRNAGGATRSQHLSGKAVDLAIAGMSGNELANKVKGWWPGGVGIYPGNRKHILHLDIGPKRHWGF